MGYFLFLFGSLFVGSAVILFFLSIQECENVLYDELRNFKNNNLIEKDNSDKVTRQNIINQFNDISSLKIQKSMTAKAQKLMEFENTLELARKRVK